MKSRIYQQLLVRSYSNFKLKRLGSNQSVQRYEMKTTVNGRRPQTEDDLKIGKVIYLSHHWWILLKFETEALGIESKVSNEDDPQ